MTILYQDNFIICDDDALTIDWYYFPFGSKRIPYKSIKNFSEENIGLFTGQGRIWGMGFSPHWFHLDPQRPTKTKCIILDDGEWIKSVITPDDCERVMQILRDKIA